MEERENREIKFELLEPKFRSMYIYIYTMFDASSGHLMTYSRTSNAFSFYAYVFDFLMVRFRSCGKYSQEMQTSKEQKSELGA